MLAQWEGLQYGAQGAGVRMGADSPPRALRIPRKGKGSAPGSWPLALGLAQLCVPPAPLGGKPGPSLTSVSLKRWGSRHGFHLTEWGDGMKSKNG